MFIERIFSAIEKIIFEEQTEFQVENKSFVCAHTNIHTNKLIQACLNMPAKNHINPNDVKSEIFTKKAAGSDSCQFTFSTKVYNLHFQDFFHQSVKYIFLFWNVSQLFNFSEITTNFDNMS